LDSSKRSVVIYDYVDSNEPMFAKMAARREVGYRSLGYQTVNSAQLGLCQWQPSETVHPYPVPAEIDSKHIRSRQFFDASSAKAKQSE